jgi:8-oxo-dGTP diphosphatase
VNIDESLEVAVRRELEEETGITRLYLEQLYSFGEPKRDPRERVISVAYYALVKLADHKVRAASDARNVAWFPVADLPALAFDHEEILEVGLRRLKGKIRYEPIGFELLPEKFPLSELQRLYETIIEQPLDKRNFRKKILSMGLIADTEEIQQDVAHRAARLYRFDEPAYRRLKKGGFNFEL